MTHPAVTIDPMTSSSTLQFEFESNPLRFPVMELEPSSSPFTGRQLRKATTRFTISSGDAETVRRFVAAGPIADSEGTLWSGNLDMESYTNDGPHSLTITWTETERVNADVVEFEGLMLRPTRYEERTNDDGSIVVAFQATLTADETDRLRSLVPARSTGARYWPVVRRGVADEPRSMRLGRVLWQQLDDGTIGHDITLVDEAYDTTDKPNAFLALGGEPMVSNLVHHLSSLIAQYETLLAELEAAGVLAPEALNRIRVSAESLGPDRQHAFFEVSDISKW